MDDVIDSTCCDSQLRKARVQMYSGEGREGRRRQSGTCLPPLAVRTVPAMIPSIQPSSQKLHAARLVVPPQRFTYPWTVHTWRPPRNTAPPPVALHRGRNPNTAPHFPLPPPGHVDRRPLHTLHDDVTPWDSVSQVVPPRALHRHHHP
ncbi:uncharacterized protein LOC143287945 [Babylonia areolata]|uniref:uncharacterized protein LOC143287945 n=1 Tax=Babylonia areolata TaxID=304850 RepID=UPI003FD2D9C1